MSNTEPLAPAYTYRAVAKRILDGDTAVIEADLGFEVFAAVHVRIRGVDTPELRAKDPKPGQAARVFLDALLLPASKPPVALLLRSYARSFERWVGDLWCMQAGEWRSVAEQIITAGHGVAIKP
jgi:endonuclease YncB( thermonuclease family)